MALGSRMKSILRNLTRKGTVEEELDREVGSLFEMLVEEKCAAGKSLQEANREASFELGGREQLKEHVRRARSGASLDTLGQDIRFSLRMLRKNPMFAVVAVLTLGLGIGVNTSIFSFVDGILLRPLPFPEPQRIVSVFTTWLPQGVEQDIFSYPNFLDVAQQNKSLSAVATHYASGFDLTDSGEPATIRAERVTSDFFNVLGVPPHLGRTFSAEEDASSNTDTVVLSYGLWQQRFGGDPGVIGNTITLTGTLQTVVGVMPEGFSYPAGVQIWAPIGLSDRQKESRGNVFLDVIARLRPGSELEAAQVEMDTLARRLAADYPDLNAGMGLLLVLLQDQIVGTTRPALIVLSWAVAFVLLIATVNLANLLLASATARNRELVVRSALGASRGRLIRQLLTESLVVAALGGAAGLAFGSWSIDTLVSASPTSLPRLGEVSLNMRVFGFTALLSLLTGLIFGLIPAAGLSRPDSPEVLKEGRHGGGTGRRQGHFWRALVVAEVALVMVLLTGAGLMARSFFRMLAVDPGFQPNNVLSLQLFLPGNRYPDAPTRLNFYRELLPLMQSIPGVESVGTVDVPPIGPAGDMVSDLDFRIEGRPDPGPGKTPVADFSRISPGYFSALKIPLLRGRFFHELDTGEAPNVAIVSKEFANRYLSGEDPLGKRILLSRSRNIVAEIVGVVGDVRHLRLKNSVRPELYVPFEQFPTSALNLMIRSTGSPSEIVPVVKTRLWSLDKGLPTTFMGELRQLVGSSVSNDRLTTFLLLGFGFLALALSAVGILGVISYTVAQRTQEFGVRIALGAARSDILALVLRQGMLPAMLGVVVGLGGALLLTRFVSTLLFEVSATDPSTFAAVSLLLLLVALLACYLPARRAARVDPIVALRFE